MNSAGGEASPSGGRLSGRCVMLTGASGGIGSALCAALLAEGARVVAVGRDHARLQALTSGPGGHRVQPIVANLDDAIERRRLCSEVAALPHPPAILVLAHARSAFGLFESQSEDELQALIHTNLLAPMQLIHALLPTLRAQSQPAVVAVGSTFGSLAFPGFAAYSATKFGLRGLIEGLAREYADSGVAFQYLSPRATRTAFNTPAVEAMNREMKVAQDDPDEVAALLVDAIARGRRRLQIGWPEKLFARLNGALPGLVDRSLRAQLPVVRRHARP